MFSPRKEYHKYRFNFVYLNLITLILGISECLVNPCENGGTCEDVDPTAQGSSAGSGALWYKCLCLPGFKGTKCEIGEQLGIKGHQGVIKPFMLCIANVITY